MPDDFYVESHECMACGAPPAVAPNLMGFDENSTEYVQCYFQRQPENEREQNEAIAAVEASCCGAVRYRGNDLYVLGRLGSSFDQPETLKQYPRMQDELPVISTPEPSFLERLLRSFR